MGGDLVLISWNVEKKSLADFAEGSDTATLIANSIAETVAKVGSKGGDTPFVSYLIEMKGSEGNLKEVCTRLQDAYRSASGGQEVEVRVNDLGGARNTRESIITMSRGVKIENKPLDIQAKVKPHIENDFEQAKNSFEEHRTRRETAARNKTSRSYAKVDHFRKNKKDPEWFRNGVTSEIEFDGTALRVSAVHSPGPKFVQEFPKSVDAAQEAAYDTRSDLLVGDFNRDGDFSGRYYTDRLIHSDKGTTFSKSALKRGKNELGVRKRDRIFELNRYSKWDFTVHEPIVKGRGPFQARLTDHAMICVGAKKKPVIDPADNVPYEFPPRGPRDNFGASGFGNNTNAHNASDDLSDTSEDEADLLDEQPRKKFKPSEFTNNTNAHNASDDLSDVIDGQSASQFDLSNIDFANLGFVNNTNAHNASDDLMDISDALADPLTARSDIILGDQHLGNNTNSHNASDDPFDTPEAQIDLVSPSSSNALATSPSSGSDLLETPSTTDVVEDSITSAGDAASDSMDAILSMVGDSAAIDDVLALMMMFV